MPFELAKTGKSHWYWALLTLKLLAGREQLDLAYAIHNTVSYLDPRRYKSTINM